MRWKPEDAVAVVTGASSGIGRSLCELLVANGSHVIAVARRADRIESLANAEGTGRVIPIVGDITEEAVRSRIVRAAASVRDGEVCW